MSDHYNNRSYYERQLMRQELELQDVPLTGSNSLDRIAFGKRVRNLLDRQNKTQTELAQALGVSEGTVSSWINGRKFPRMGKVYAMADYLGVSMAYLLGVTKDPYSAPERTPEETEQDLINMKRQELYHKTRACSVKQLDVLLKIADIIIKEDF